MNQEEKEELISKIHPESPFSERTIEAIYLIESVPQQELLIFSYLHEKIITEIQEPFVDLCQKLVQNLPSNILSIINLKESNVSIHIKPDFAMENNFRLHGKEYNYNLIILFHSDYFICVFQSDKEFKKDTELIIIKHYLYLFNYPEPFHYHKYNESSGYELWFIPINDIFEKSSDDLIDSIVEAFNYLFPFILMTICENPLPRIEEHLKIWNPRYKIDKYVDKTGIDRDILSKWIKTLQRKKQIIFQGSPGTGKTFIAENIAQYLIGGTDGFYEIVQFHPAYTYEDFMQGIRPQTNNGQSKITRS